MPKKSTKQSDTKLNMIIVQNVKPVKITKKNESRYVKEFEKAFKKYIDIYSKP